MLPVARKALLLSTRPCWKYITLKQKKSDYYNYPIWTSRKLWIKILSFGENKKTRLLFGILPRYSLHFEDVSIICWVKILSRCNHNFKGYADYRKQANLLSLSFFRKDIQRSQEFSWQDLPQLVLRLSHFIHLIFFKKEIAVQKRSWMWFDNTCDLWKLIICIKFTDYFQRWWF